MGQKAKFGIKKREKGINVTPFVDVLLVVLVIFILTSNASIPTITAVRTSKRHIFFAAKAHMALTAFARLY